MASGSRRATGRAARSSTRPTRRSSPRSTSPRTSRSRQAIAAARRAFDATDWPRTPTGERAALLERVAALIDRDLEELAVEETQNTGKAMRESRWDIADVARVFRYYAQLADKEGGRLVDTSNPDALSPHRLRAGRRMRAHRAVELPAPPAVVEDRPGPRRRQHRGDEAGPGHAADRDPPDEAARGGRHAARRRQPRPRSGRARRPGARRLPRRRPHLADRRHRGRPRADPGLRGQHQARRPRARRQEPEHRVRRRRLRDGRRQRPDRGLHPLRPGLLGRLPGDRPGRASTTASSRRSAGAPTDPPGPRQRRRDRGRRAHLGRAPRQGRGLRRGARSPKAPAWSPAAADPTSPSSRPASSTARRSSPTSAATCASSARRSSARS